ncbi:MAG: hypothetical protein NVSMB23_04930 [Myxococcales bacterium]
MAIDSSFSSNGNGHHDGDTFQHAKVMVDEARAFGRSLSDSAQTFTQAVDLRGRVNRNPIGMIAAGLGVGYLLGGGLFTPLTGKLVRYGMRFAILPLIRGPLMAMAGSAGAAAASSSGRGGAGSL